MKVPDAEVVIDEELVTRLVRDGFPHLDQSGLTFVSEGWDNSVWRLGDDVVRVPRREASAPLLENELRWLDAVTRDVSLETPAPLRRGGATAYYPWAWALGRWIEGRPGDEELVATSVENARRLGQFFRELHRVAPAGAPRNALRGGSLAQRSSAFSARLGELGDALDREKVTTAWRRATSASPWAAAPVWLHGDPHPANLVYRDGRLTGVVDFGDLGQGDPATDLAGGLLSCDLERFGVLVDVYGSVDESTIRRAAGWALYYGVMFTAVESAQRPTYRAIGDRAVANALAVLNGR